MDERYLRITQARCANIDQYNRRQDQTAKLPRLVIFFDEVANWMQDDEFKNEVDGLINEIATKSRAAGLHLFMIYQRADNQVMTMQLRTNLGNKLILRLGDEGSSRIALGGKRRRASFGERACNCQARLGSENLWSGALHWRGRSSGPRQGNRPSLGTEAIMMKIAARDIASAGILVVLAIYTRPHCVGVPSLEQFSEKCSEMITTVPEVVGICSG